MYWCFGLSSAGILFVGVLVSGKTQKVIRDFFVKIGKLVDFNPGKRRRVKDDGKSLVSALAARHQRDIRRGRGVSSAKCPLVRSLRFGEQRHNVCEQFA